MRESVRKSLYAYDADELLFMQGRKQKVSAMSSDPHDVNVLGREVVARSGQMIDVRRHTRFLPVPPHRHDYIEALYVHNGTLAQTIDGERLVMQAGDLMVLNQGIIHSIERTGQSDIAINLVILPEFFNYLFSLVDVDNYIMNFIMDSMYHPTGEGGYLLYRAQGKSIVEPLLDEIIENVYEPTTASGITIRLLAGLMLVRLAEHSDDVTFYSADSYEKRISLDILRYIDEHYQEGSLAAVSQELNQPDWRICRIIKRYTGKTFKELVQDTRLVKAAHALTHTNRSIAEIAEMVGYHNMTYFYRLFKERYSMTPAAYRASLIGDAASSDMAAD